MDIIPKQVLNLAAKYIGYKEKASNKDLYSFEGNAGKENFSTVGKIYLRNIKYIFSPTKLIFLAKDYKYRGNYMDNDGKTVSGLLEAD